MLLKRFLVATTGGKGNGNIASKVCNLNLLLAFAPLLKLLMSDTESKLLRPKIKMLHRIAKTRNKDCWIWSASYISKVSLVTCSEFLCESIEEMVVYLVDFFFHLFQCFHNN